MAPERQGTTRLVGAMLKAENRAPCDLVCIRMDTIERCGRKGKDRGYLDGDLEPKTLVFGSRGDRG